MAKYNIMKQREKLLGRSPLHLSSRGNIFGHKRSVDSLNKFGMHSKSQPMVNNIEFGGAAFLGTNDMRDSNNFNMNRMDKLEAFVENMQRSINELQE